MTTAVALDWNTWRSAYDEMTPTEQRAFYDEVHRLHPEQARFSERELGRLLAHIGQPVSVVELGGWDGGFADAMLPGSSIRSWESWEVSGAACIGGNVCHDLRYVAVCPANWYWSTAHRCDLFVSSHTIEHLRFRDVLATFDATDCEWMYLQSPLREGPTEWANYHGSHILEVGWGEITHELDARGFDELESLRAPNVRSFQRRA